MSDIPLGFSSAAVKCGLKNNDYDLAVIKSDPPSIVSALYTQNTFQAAPIIFSKKNDKNKINLLIVNSKIANSLTGKKGLDDVIDIVKYASDKFNIKKDNILISSTGIIGVELDTKKIKNGIDKANKSFNNNFDNIARAIQTRDKFDKIYTTELDVSGKTAKFYAVAKGSSIVHPNMATILLFIFTDLNIEKISEKIRSGKFQTQMITDILRDTYNISVVGNETNKTVTINEKKDSNSSNLSNSRKIPIVDLEFFKNMLKEKRYIINNKNILNKAIFQQRINLLGLYSDKFSHIVDIMNKK